MIQLLDPTSFDFTTPVFEFDCELSEDRTVEVEWTKYPIELGANVSDFGVKNPLQFTVSGICTATPLDTLEASITRLSDISALLRQLAEACQPLMLVTATWVENVVIVSVNEKRNRDTGEAVEIEVKLQTIFQPVPLTVDIPPELLRVDVKHDATPAAAAGGAASPVPVEEDVSWGADILDAVSGS
ncbi:MAG: phage baseplate protein [Patescibacteria group bacterium]|jgi:hypothetical protein